MMVLYIILALALVLQVGSQCQNINQNPMEYTLTPAFSGNELMVTTDITAAYPSNK